MSWIDKKYIDIIGPRLDRFVWKREDLANCRCPSCGDSETNSRKARGFFILKRDADFYYYLCHNCGYSNRVLRFLRDFFPEYVQSYIAETYIDKGKKKKKVEEVDPLPEDFKVDLTFHKEIEIEGATLISDLYDMHPHKKYVIDRKIPEYFFNKIYSTSDYLELVSRYAPSYSGKLVRFDDRVVFPLRKLDGSLFGFVGRTLNDRQERYLTVKIDEDHPKVYGLERLDKSKTIRVLEGPIDSLFINNSIACCGTYLSPEYLKSLGKCVVILDNQPRHRTVVDTMVMYAKAGIDVCVWKNISTRYKDVNDMIMKGGMTAEHVENVIKSNTYSGLRAISEIKFWAK